MAQFTTPPVIDGFETTLAQAWDWLTGTIYVNAIPNATLSGWDKTYAVVNPWKTTQQVARISWWPSGQLTCDSITVEKWAGTNYSSTTHAVKSKVIITDTYQTWEDIKTAVNSKASTDSSNIRTAEQTFNWEWYPPEYTTTQRDAITWNRDGAIISNTTTGTNQQRTGWAWVDIGDTGTSNASDTVAGKVEMATLAEVDAGTSTWWTGARLAVWPAELVNIKSVWALVDSTFLAWENVTANDSLFAEAWPTFAESTTVQAIGDSSWNTRVAIRMIGSWVAGTTFKLWLRKYTSPSANLSVRIETDSSWPTGTLVDANATSSVTAASLTTSLVDTTVTLAWSVTIPAGTVVRIVLSQVWDVVNGTNYYWVWYVDRDTTARTGRLYNGTVYWSAQSTVLYYVSWSIFESTVLSKTDSDYIYKLPTNFPRFATETKTIGQRVTTAYSWLRSWFTGLSSVPYYISNTPWAISTSVGTYTYSVWDGYNGTSLNIYPKTVFWKTASQTITTSTVWDEFHRFTAPVKWVYTLAYVASTGSGWQTIRIVINSTIVYESSSIASSATSYTGTFLANTGDIIQFIGRSASGTSTINISDIQTLI